jgi:hypothetical protein
MLLPVVRGGTSEPPEIDLGAPKSFQEEPKAQPERAGCQFHALSGTNPNTLILVVLK